MSMNNAISNKWNKTYLNHYDEEVPEPCSVLSHYGYLLPKKGLALDLACGRAGNGFYMADLGLEVQAIDLSPVAIEYIHNESKKRGLPVQGIIRDIESTGLPVGQYDVIVVSNFLNRKLIPDIIEHLKEGGMLFYQTWIANKIADVGPKNPDFLLNEGELLGFCKEMRILHYHEEGLIGDMSRGQRNQASIIAVR